jgi:serine/threonine protein phosphatase 1
MQMRRALESNERVELQKAFIIRDSESTTITMREAMPTRTSVPSGIRVYAIGDIHGCATLLDRLHALIDRDIEAALVKPEQTLIIYLGDYIDRGPDTAAVLETLTSPPGRRVSRVFLKGNHEDMLLRFLQDPDRSFAWCDFGGFETVMSYGIDVGVLLDKGSYRLLRDELAARMPPSHEMFITALKTSFTVGDYFFCHAGVRPGIGLDEQSAQDLMWIREPFLASTSDHGKVVVHSHTPVEAPDVRPNRIDIDTGAYATGRLTALVLDGFERRFLTT